MSRAAVLAAARSQLGRVEAPPNSNRTPYGKAYGMDGSAWCAMFVWWCFREAKVLPLIPKTAYTPTFAGWFKQNGMWSATPQVGDLAFFDFPGDNVNRISHIAFVEAVNKDGSVITIEGNTSAGTKGSQRDGGGVYRRTRTHSGGIVGYGRPAYTDKVAAPAPANGTVRALRAAVRLPLTDTWDRALDGALNLMRDANRGHLPNVRGAQAVVGVGLDGAWGPRSKAALIGTTRNVQTALNVGADGAWGDRSEAAWAAARKRYGVGL